MLYGISKIDFFKSQFTNVYDSYASYVMERFARFNVQEWANQKISFV